MRVLVAPDKFKGSLTAREVATAIGEGLEAAGVASRLLPLADGGDGSVAAAVHAGSTARPVTVRGADGRPHRTEFAIDGTTAVVEVAGTCGLGTLPPGVTAPMTASSHGFGEAVLAAVVRNRTDRQLHRLFDRGPGLAVIFKGMERAFLPERARGFEGEVTYQLRGRDGQRAWTVRIEAGRAAVRRGAAAAPAVTLRTSVPDFVRMAAGEAFPPKLLLEGALAIEGDYALAGRLPEMFGAELPT